MKNKVYKEIYDGKETGRLYTPVTRYLQVKMGMCTKASRYADFCYFDEDEKYAEYFYFMYNRMKIALREVVRLTHSIFVEDGDGKLVVISGCYTVSNALGLLVEMDESGEYVRVWKALEP